MAGIWHERKNGLSTAFLSPEIDEACIRSHAAFLAIRGLEYWEANVLGIQDVDAASVTSVTQDGSDSVAGRFSFTSEFEYRLRRFLEDHFTEWTAKASLGSRSRVRATAPPHSLSASIGA